MFNKARYILINSVLYNTKALVFLFYILNFMFNSQLQAQQFKTHFYEGIISSEIQNDSISNRLRIIKEEAVSKNDTVLLIKTLITLSAFERYRLNFDIAFSYAGEASLLSEEFGKDIYQAKAQEELGIITYLFKQNEESGNYFTNSHKVYKKLFLEGEIGYLELHRSHYNLVMHNQRIMDQDNLRAHIDTCAILSKQFKTDPIAKLYLDEKQSSLEEWNGNLNKALALLHGIASKLENIAPNSGLKQKDQRFLLIVYGRIACIYLKTNELDLAERYFEKFTKINGVLGETTFYRSFLYSRYAEVLFKLGKYNKAYEYEQKSNVIGNTYLDPRNEKNKGFLTIVNPFREQLRKKNEQLNLKNLELAKQRENILSFRIILFVILLILVIAGFMIRSRMRSLKFQRKERDSNELINVKNKELTANTLQLIEKEEVIKTLSNYIKDSNNDKQSQSLLKSIERSSVSLWDAFNTRFKEQNIGFYERLQKKVPNLSSSDLKLCALIKLNFSGKEMAYLLGISLGSVHVARHRLRKKMKLERDKNLTNFINSI